MEQECVKLRIDMDILDQKRTKIAADSETKLAVAEKEFRDYRISHHRKLHDLHVELERAMNEIGMRCLPYPEKGSTIGMITAWLTQEIQALSNAIAKANKKIWCIASSVF
jgi:hypothetical protein